MNNLSHPVDRAVSTLAISACARPKLGIWANASEPPVKSFITGDSGNDDQQSE